MIRIELTKGQLEELYWSIRDIPELIMEDLHQGNISELGVEHDDMISAVKAVEAAWRDSWESVHYLLYMSYGLLICTYRQKTHMSTLHHESILEDCMVEAEETFRLSNKLTQKELDELLVRSQGVRDAIISQANKLFEDQCI